MIKDGLIRVGSDKFYYLNGVLHRDTGPAAIVGDREYWWYNDKRILCNSQEEFE